MITTNGRKISVRKGKLAFPNLISEGKKYGLSEEQISQLTRYLNDKRMLNLISLAKFNEDARAWLSALTGIVANVLEVDAHIAIWLDKKMEKPRNWVLSKLVDALPTNIDNIAYKAIQVASDIRDNKILPLQEKILGKVNDRMHDRYQYHVTATHLGNSFKDLKSTAKTILKDSKDAAQGAFNTLKDRKFETHILGGYHDEDGNFINLKKYGKNASINYFNKRKDTNNNGKQEEKQQEFKTSNSTGEIP